MVFRPRNQIEVVDPSTVKLRGYAAVTGVEFTWFDRSKRKKRRFQIEPGAFSSVLERLGDEPLSVYWSHQTFRLQLGQTSVLEERKGGLYYEAMAFNTSEAIDVLTVIDGRERTGASFGFEFGEVKEEKSGLERIYSFSDLYELGPTPNGANPQAYTEIVDLDEASEPAEPELVTEPEPEAAALAATVWQAVAEFRNRRF